MAAQGVSVESYWLAIGVVQPALAFHRQFGAHERTYASMARSMFFEVM